MLSANVSFEMGECWVSWGYDILYLQNSEVWKLPSNLPKPKMWMYFYIVVCLYIPVQLSDAWAKNSSEGPTYG